MGARRKKPDGLRPRKLRPDTPGGLLARKVDRLDWQSFNFLENLLTFCVQKTRRAPAESGVKFGIRPAVRADGVCLLFKIDRPSSDALMPAAGIKPDYLVVHISRQHGCLCTIVEMKGRDLNKAEHAIDQIKTLWDRLRSEVSEHVPGALRKYIHYQGIILTPHNAQVPLRKLEATKKQLVISVLQYSKTFDLYDYVRRPLKYGERYTHPPPVAPDPDEFNAMEVVLACGGLPERLKVTCCEKEVEGEPPRHKGLWLDFANPGNDNCEERGLDGDEEDFVRLLVTPKRLRLVREDRSADFVALLQQALQARKLATDGLFGPCT